MIQLYMREGCPFCRKVLQAAFELELEEGEDFEIIDASPGTAGENVVLSKGGKDMVPFLVDGDTSMYESEDIIAYLKNVF